jgi:hypothetical protein
MRFYIKNPENKLQATCRYNKETKLLTLERSSLISKKYVCNGCDKVEELRLSLMNKNLLKDHNEEMYLLMEEVQFNDINSAVCLVLGGHVSQSERIIKNEFGDTLADVYKEALK